MYKVGENCIEDWKIPSKTSLVLKKKKKNLTENHVKIFFFFLLVSKMESSSTQRDINTKAF